MLTVGSLFSGIGGLDLGFERAGFEIKFQVEIDPYCRRVLAKHWPDVARYEDVRHVGAHNLEWVDVIMGGFPCQDISIAGRGAGLDGERSGLWFEFYRVVCEVRPRYIIVENVPALLHRGVDVVLGQLAEAGYDAEWQCIPAAAFGAPHLRWRAFIVGYSVCQRCGRQGIQHDTGAVTCARSENGSAILADTRRDGSEPERKPAHLASPQAANQGREEEWQRVWDASWGSSQDVAHAVSPRLEIFQRQFGHDGPQCTPAERNGNGRDWWAVEPNVGRVANGVPRRVDRLRGLGNAVVPQVAEYVAECVLQFDQARDDRA